MCIPSSQIKSLRFNIYDMLGYLDVCVRSSSSLVRTLAFQVFHVHEYEDSP